MMWTLRQWVLERWEIVWRVERYRGLETLLFLNSFVVVKRCRKKSVSSVTFLACMNKLCEEENEFPHVSDHKMKKHWRKGFWYDSEI